MTEQEYLEHLLSLGYFPAQAERMVQERFGGGQPGGQPTGVEGVLPPGQQVDVMELSLQDERLRDEAPVDPLPPDPVDVEDPELQQAFYIYQSNPELLTPEQRRQVEELPESEVQKLAELFFSMGPDGFNWDYIYNQLSLKPGSLEAPGSLMSLFRKLVHYGLIDEDPEEEEEQTLDRIREFLTRMGGNETVQFVIQEWGEENDVYTPTMQTDGIDNRDIARVAQELGISAGQAITINRFAEARKIDPVELGRLWMAQERPGHTLDNERGRGSATAAPHGDASAPTSDESGRRRPRGAPADALREHTSPEVMGGRKFGHKSISEIAAGYRSGLDLYDGSRVLASTHLFDPELALRLQRDPWSIDSGELRRILGYLGDETGESLPQDAQVSWIRERLAGGFNVTTSVDSGRVKEAVKTLADAWNLTGSEGIAAAMASRLMGEAVARARASLPNPFSGLGGQVNVLDQIEDVTSHIRMALRQLPEYAELFGHLREGEAEEDYVGRFESQSQQVLGDLNTDVVRSGMRSGNVNTVYQQGLHGAGDASTRFQQIIARNAEVFRNML